MGPSIELDGQQIVSANTYSRLPASEWFVLPTKMLKMTWRQF